MNKKAISPLIATVLIIGFTIVLAAVVLQWAGGFVKNLTSEQEKTVNLQTACMGLDLDITSAILTKNKTIETPNYIEDEGNFVVKLANNNADKTIAGALVLVETATERITLDDEKTGDLNKLDPLESTTWTADVVSTNSDIPSTLGTFAVDANSNAKLIVSATQTKGFKVGDKLMVIPQVSVSGEPKTCDIGVAAKATITAE